MILIWESLGTSLLRLNEILVVRIVSTISKNRPKQRNCKIIEVCLETFPFFLLIRPAWSVQSWHFQLEQMLHKLFFSALNYFLVDKFIFNVLK